MLCIYLSFLNQLKFTILFNKLKCNNSKIQILIKTHEMNKKISSSHMAVDKSNNEPLGFYYS